jgi:hypothetical protein
MPSCCYTSETVWYASGIVENLYGCDGVAVIPILWITKEMMSRGPQVADMECRETT